MATILVLTNMYPPHHYGGYELSCQDVVRGWRRRGHRVEVLTSTLRVPDASGDPDPGVRRELTIAFDRGQLVSPPLHRRRRIERDNQQALRRALAEVRPDVVSVWAMGAMSTGLLRTLADSGVPLVYVVCDDWPTYARALDPWMRLFSRLPSAGRVLEPLVGVPCCIPNLDDTGTFCFVSDTTRRRCVTFSPWRFPNSTVTYSGIDLHDFPVAAAPPEREWRWRLISVGRPDPRKGVATALRALSLLPPETTLMVYGAVEGPYPIQLDRLATELGVVDRVRFERVPRQELRRAYENADVCVFPTEWEEPFGLVPLEAMACATPVVATGTGGSGEFLLDGVNCLRCGPGDPASLADAVSRLSREPATRRRLVEAGLATASELTVDRLTDVLEEWHLAAAARFSEGRPRPRELTRLGSP